MLKAIQVRRVSLCGDTYVETIVVRMNPDGVTYRHVIQPLADW